MPAVARHCARHAVNHERQTPPSQSLHSSALVLSPACRIIWEFFQMPVPRPHFLPLISASGCVRAPHWAILMGSQVGGDR